MTYNEVVTLVKSIAEGINPTGVFLHGRNYDTTLAYDKLFPQIQLYPFIQSIDNNNINVVRTVLTVAFLKEDGHDNTMMQRQGIIAEMDDLTRLFEAQIRVANKVQVMSIRREPQYLIQMGVVSGMALEITINSGLNC